MIESSKDVVKLRTKKLSDGSESIYLDIYLDGKRKYEYLKLYLLPGKENKAKNKETIALANAVKAKRIVDIQNGRFGFEKKSGEKMLLTDYMDSYIEEKKKKKVIGYINDLCTVAKHVKKYIGRKTLYLSDIDKKWCLGFISYLDKVRTKSNTPLETGTKHLYYTVMVVAMNKAVRKGLIVKNPFDMVDEEDKPRRGEPRREYLTLDEVKELMETGIKDERIKQAFLFSCFTGLRFSDIIGITWADVKELEDGVVQLEFVQKKTKNSVVVPLNANALQWLPNRGWKDEKVFDLPHHSVVGKKLKKWVGNAGITKNITFHVARHTYATLLLYYGADLYTVSKLLGHTDVKTTEIYAKVMDESKRKAVNLIPDMLKNS